MYISYFSRKGGNNFLCGFCMCHELLSVVWENHFAVDRTVLLHQRFCRVLLCCLYIWFRLFFPTGSCLLEHMSLVGCLVSVVFLGLCLVSLVSCLFISGSSLVCQSQDYLRSAGQSGCIEGCAASNSGRSLKFELSLAMRGKAVMSTEKR